MNRFICGGIVACMMAFVGCQAATTDTPHVAAPGVESPAIESPTVANLTGTWAETSPTTSQISSSTSSGTESRINSYTFAVDGTFSRFETIVLTPSSGTASTSYYQDKGTYSIDGNTVNLVFNQYRTPTSASDSTTAWSTSTQTSTLGLYTVLHDGKLYGLQQQILVAQGSVSGLVGTWALVRYDGDTYYKYMYQFSQDSLVFSVYSSTTTTFPTTASSTNTLSYTATASTLTADSHTLYYLRFADHLAMGEDASAGVYTKQ